MAMNFFKSNGTMNEVKTKDYIRRNLGLEIVKNRDRLAIKALNDPVQFLEDREDTINNMIMPKVEKRFNEKLGDFIEMGFPDDSALQLATEEGRKEFQAEIAMLEMMSPGAYNKAFGVGELKDGIRHQAKEIVLNDTVDEGEIITRYKALKKARKAPKK